MSILIEKGYVLTLDGQDRFYERGDVLIQGDRISQVGENIEISGTERVIDASHKLVMPGLNIAHAHSNENLSKGAFDHLPLELWMLYVYPPLDWSMSNRLIYLRTILGAAEMIRSGATTVQDHVQAWLRPEPEHLDTVFEAYRDIGMRANVATSMADKPYQAKIPSISQILPQELLDALSTAGNCKADEFIELCEYVVEKWHGYDGRLNYVLAPSGPQHWTDDFLMKLDDLSRTYNLPIHTHVLETKTQRVMGEVLYGNSIVRHLYDLGVLSPRMTLVDCIWITDEDIRLMGDSQVSVVHNPASSLKLGSGLMPLRKLLDIGCNVALGVDGMSSNDSQGAFEMMKMTASLHKIAHPDHQRWPTSDEILSMATRGGARSELIHHEVGALAPGMKADVILLRLNTVYFTPFNDAKNQLTYCETGGSVDTSIINGKVVMEGRKILTVDVDALLEELRFLMPRFWGNLEKARAWSEKLRPYLEDVYWRAVRTPIGLNRWSGDERDWLEHNVEET